MSETSDVLRPLLRDVQRLGIQVHRLHCGEARGGANGRGGHLELEPEGTPDLLVLIPGAPALYLETKVPEGGRLSVEQRETHARLRRWGHRVEVPTSAAEGLRIVNDHRKRNR